MKHCSLLRSFVLTLLATAVFVIVGCSENPVGRPCYIGPDAGQFERIVASPALECQSRACMHWPGNAEDLCTADCSEDGECDKDPQSPCKNGFACIVPMVTGPFCCKKMCVCRDYVSIPDGGMPQEPRCDPNNNDNECCNLPGRREQLPQCKTVSPQDELE
ncbi:MAG: hypothetical protein V2A73_18180 [Pseudomonadota bacterium]